MAGFANRPGLLEWARLKHTMVSMADPPMTRPPTDVAAPGLVCCRCRYDLRGQRSNGRCPECGERVETSMHRATKSQKCPQGSWVLALGLGSVFPFLLLYAGPDLAILLCLLSPMVSIAGLCVAGVSLRHWRHGTLAQRGMLVLGALLCVANVGMAVALSNVLSNHPI